MSDISQQQMDDLITSMKNSAGSLGKIADRYGSGSSSSGSSSRAGAKNTLSKDLDTDSKGLQKHTDNINRVIKSTSSLNDKTNQLSHIIGDAAKSFTGFWVISEIVKYGQENVDTYRDLNKVGQTFGGSMIEMSRQAAEAGVPLKTFAEVIKKNNVIVGQIGTKAFFDMNSQLRQSIESQGLYGYSLQELGDLQGVYMDQQRRAGKTIQFIGSPQNQKNLQDFASNLVDVSSALGANREAVLANYEAATESAQFAGAERLNEARGMGQYNDAMQQAIVSMSAQPGEAGKMLSKGLAEAFALPGGANFSQLGKEFIQAGQAGGSALMDEAKQRIANGEKQSTVVMETNNALYDMLNNPATIESLENQAQAGNEAAVAILTMRKDLTKMTQAQLDAAEKNRKSTTTFTAFFESFEQIFEGLKGSFIDGFLTPFTKGMGDSQGAFDAFWKGLDDLKPTIQALGQSLGEWAHSFFTADNLKHVGDAVVGFIQAAKSLAIGVTSIVLWMGQLFDKVHKTFDFLHKGLGDLGTAVAALALWFGAKGLMAIIGRFFMNMLAPKLMVVRAEVVNVEGAGGLGGGGGGGGGGNLSKAEREAGKAGKGIKAAEEAEEVAAKAGKLGKIGGFLGKFGKVGAAVAGIVTLGGLGEKLIGGAGNLLSKGAGRIGLAGAAKGLGRVGGMLIPGIGAGIDAASSVNSFRSGNAVAGSLYGAGAALNGAGAITAATGFGVVATPFLDAAGFIASALGMAADFTGFGQSKGKKKINPADPANPSAAAPSAGATANPSAPTPTVQPVAIDDEALAQLRTNAILGDQKSIDELKKIQEGLNKQTMVLYSVQRKTLEEQRKASAAMAAQGGY